MRSILMVMVLLGVCALHAQAKEYSVERVEMRVRVMANGSVEFVENRTYTFRGSFSRANYELSKQGFDEVRNIQVSEGNDLYLLENSSTPGTYRIRDRSRSVDIEWRYRADDESRTFTIRYILDGAVIRGTEDAEFFWTYLSDRWDNDTQSLTVDLDFERAEEVFRLDTWVLGASENVRITRTTTGFRLESVAPISRHDEVQVRSVFPARLVPALAVTDVNYTRQLALEQEEQRLADAVFQEIRRQEWLTVATPVGYLLIIGSVLLWIGFYRTWGRAPELAVQMPEFVFNPPGDLKPAIIGRFLYHEVTTGQQLVATIFDLARRGYFRIREAEPEKGRFKSRKPEIWIDRLPAPQGDHLEAFELRVLEFIDEQMTGNSDTLEALFKKSTSKTAKWYQEWSALLGKAMNDFGWRDKTVIRFAWIHAAIQLVLFLISLVMLVNAGFFPAGTIALITTIVGMVLSTTITRRTRDGQQIFQSWGAYKRTLVQAQAKVHRDMPGLSAQHLVYAIAMHVSIKRIQALVESFNLEPDELNWFVFLNTPGMGLSSIGHSVSTITSAVTATVSVSGAGASSGAAGGGAGGGAS